MAPGVTRRLMGEARSSYEPRFRSIGMMDMGHCKPPHSSGQLVTFTAFDGNDHAIIVAFGHVATEDGDNWEWFMRQLKDAFRVFFSV